MFLHIENFHHNVDQFSTIISQLQFELSTFGHEVKNFNHNPPEVIQTLEKIVGLELEYGDGSGVFRRPHEFIHYENFGPNSVYTAFVALEDNNFKIFQHKETNANFILEINTNIEEFIKNNCFDADKWNVVADINFKKGNLILIQPFQFHKLQNKLVQVFYIEKKQALKENEIKNELINSVETPQKVKKPRKKKT